MGKDVLLKISIKYELEVTGATDGKDIRELKEECKKKADAALLKCIAEGKITPNNESENIKVTVNCCTGYIQVVDVKGNQFIYK